MKSATKNSTLLVVLLSLVSLMILFQGCDNGGGDDNGGGYGPNVVVITEDITSHTTWETGKIYLIKAWDFYVSATLTIQPGVVIKFHPSEGAYLTLGSGGTIVANGTAADPIVFTSFKDDDHGGDTNGDGSATSPAAGDWGSVSTNGEQGSVFNYCEFYYGGGGSYDYTLELWDSKATVTNCIFAYNKGADDGVLDAGDARAGTVITANVFYGNEKPLQIDGVFSIDDSNTFHNPLNPSQINTYNCIYLDYPEHITSAITWSETEVPFLIDDVDWWINVGGSLTLGNDVILKFMPWGELNHNNNLSYGSGVFFTSYKDDARGGDTNGDGSAELPEFGDWEGIYRDTIPGGYESWGNIYYDNH